MFAAGRASGIRAAIESGCELQRVEFALVQLRAEETLEWVFAFHSVTPKENHK